MIMHVISPSVTLTSNNMIPAAWLSQCMPRLHVAWSSSFHWAEIVSVLTILGVCKDCD